MAPESVAKIHNILLSFEYIRKENKHLNLALRNELFVKIEQTWPELKHLNNFNIIAIMASERLVQIIVHFAKKSWSLMIVDLTSV